MQTLEYWIGLLAYDQHKGSFYWKTTRGRGVKAGAMAGTISKDGYIVISHMGSKYPAHVLAHLFMTGDWPTMEIDHINEVKSDNRWSNLRQVSRFGNMQNRRRPTSRSSTGVLGAYKRGRDFVSLIRASGKTVFLGTFKTAELAGSAYMAAKSKLHISGESA